jgi:hypothetical protein
VADRAVVGEVLRNMIGVVCAIVDRLMTGITVRGRTVEHSVHVALSTGDGEVRSGQRKGRRCMIERGRIPSRRVVTDQTVVVELPRDMVRGCNPGEIRGVAGVAIRRQADVPVVYVALSTLNSDMSAGQRESGERMVERCGAPAGCHMALRTIMREIGRDMIRILRRLKIGLMAGVAVGGGSGVPSLTVYGVTGSTGRRLMHSRERESRQIMVEGRGSPAARGMTDRAPMTEISSHVIGVRRTLKIGLMAGIAIGGETRPTRLTVDGMTGQTGRGGMPSGQGEAAEVVIESGILPVGKVNAVALTAIGGKGCDYVIRIGCGLIVGKVA